MIASFLSSDTTIHAAIFPSKDLTNDKMFPSESSLDTVLQILPAF